jgi:hypothetical protein
MSPKDHTVNAAGLEKFLARWQLTARQAGDQLGVSERMIFYYLNGKYEIPKWFSLLITLLDEKWRRTNPSKSQ